MSIGLEITALERFRPTASDPTAPPATGLSPSDLLIIGVGNSGETTALRMAALGRADGLTIGSCGINNDRLAPTPLTIMLPDDDSATITLDARLTLGGENPRDQIADHPLLVQRYARLLRGVAVFETYPRAGYGGHGHPVISTLDIDLGISELLVLLRRVLRQVRGDTGLAAGGSDMQRLAAQQRQISNRRGMLRIVIIGGGSGSMGNAAHHLLPYLVRHVLAELGVTDYELWGVVLGPQAFSGLTPFVRHNYRALIQALDHLARHGQQRRYLHDLQISSQRPPYDRTLLLDDPQLPGDGARVGEAELERFFDRTALSLYLLLARGTVWPRLASSLVNDDGSVMDGRLRLFATVRAALADLDLRTLRAVLTAHLEGQLLDQLAARLAA